VVFVRTLPKMFRYLETCFIGMVLFCRKGVRNAAKQQTRSEAARRSEGSTRHRSNDGQWQLGQQVRLSPSVAGEPCLELAVADLRVQGWCRC